VPDLPKYGEAAGRARGADASLALADPSYILAVDLYSNSSFLSKTLAGLPNSGGGLGGVWVLSDMAIADELTMTPVALGNANGAFVAPTPETMTSAVSRMEPDASGVLQLDPTVTAPAGQPQPYPLTYVEYAMVPAEPLVDATCTARPDSQAALAAWLDYLVSPEGQSELSPGMVALTPELQTQAAAAIAQVGAAPLTCTPPPPPPGTSPTTFPAGGYDTSGYGGSSGYASNASYGSLSSSMRSLRTTARSSSPNTPGSAASRRTSRSGSGSRSASSTGG